MNWKSMVPAVVATVLVGGGVALAAETVPSEPEPIASEEIVPSPEETPTLEDGTETESEGTWLVWNVKGAGGTAWFACLDIGSRICSGDMDTD